MSVPVSFGATHRFIWNWVNSLVWITPQGGNSARMSGESDQCLFDPSSVRGGSIDRRMSCSEKDITLQFGGNMFVNLVECCHDLAHVKLLYLHVFCHTISPIEFHILDHNKQVLLDLNYINNFAFLQKPIFRLNTFTPTNTKWFYVIESHHAPQY